MLTELRSFALLPWFAEAWEELVRSFHSMDSMQWAILSACSVTLGFICLRGHQISR